MVSTGQPDDPEMDTNLDTFLGEDGRRPPPNLGVGQALLLDGVALEEVGRYDLQRNCILGFCREHSGAIEETQVNSIQDIEKMAELLESKKWHHGKDGTLVGIAPITAEDHYFVSPLILSPSCKSEGGKDAESWLSRLLHCYKVNPNGQSRHGRIYIIATDGESSFRLLRNLIGLKEDLDRNSPVGKIIYSLPGINCRTGRDGILGTCDPKHIIKRFATMLRSPTGIQVGDTQVTTSDILDSLLQLENMTPQKAEILLNPADKQNVPKAVNLLQSLFELGGKKDIIATPTLVQRVKKVFFISNVLSYFLFPFIKVELCLGEQLRSLSTYAHLITALVRKHKSAFITNALIFDSQSIVKSIFYTAARLQGVDPTLKYFILFEGTDRLEGVFSHARTQDHAWNFDVLQLAQKLCIGAEINAIFEKYPELDRGHYRRNLVGTHGVDHINPKSWIGDVVIDNVDIHAEYLEGRRIANQILQDQFKSDPVLDWDLLFSEPQIDHLRPTGTGKYIGTRTSSDDQVELEEEEDDDLEILTGGLFAQETDDEFEDARENCLRSDVDLDGEQGTDQIPGELNPAAEPKSQHYLLDNGKKLYKPTIIARMLQSLSSARKTTHRPSRAQGVALENLVKRQFQSRNHAADEDTSDDGSKLKAGDLGAILTKASNQICLSVAEILNFRQGVSKMNLGFIEYDDLEAQGPRSVTLATQILKLAPKTIKVDSGDEILIWQWTKEYIQTQQSKDQSITQRNFGIRIPGSIFHPLGPMIVNDDGGNPTWGLTDSYLKEILDQAWAELDPEGDDILATIKLLPEITGDGVPYRLGDLNLTPQFVVPNLSAIVNLIELKGDTEIPCHLCGAQQLLRNMRNHVGKHILLSLRDMDDREKKPGVEVSQDFFY